jgi:hypothetical protein
MTMIVPVPRWCENNVPSAHADFLTFDGGEAAVAFDDEAEGKSDVTVGAGCFTWLDEL